MAYNYNPQPQYGTNAFGMVPGAISPVTAAQGTATSIGSPAQVATPNPYADISAIYPNLGKSNAQASGIISGQMAGQLSPETLNNIQNAGAAWGVSSGMPGSGLAGNNALRNLGLTTEGLQQQGVSNFGSIMPALAATETVSPSLQAQIGTWNAGAQNNVASQNASAANQFGLANMNAQNQTNALNLGVTETNALNAAAPNPTMASNATQALWQSYADRARGPGGGTGGFAPMGSFNQDISNAYNYNAGGGQNPYLSYTLGSGLSDIGGNTSSSGGDYYEGY